MDRRELWEAIGRALGQARYAAGLTQQEVARRVGGGISHATVGRIERGEDLPEDRHPETVTLRARHVEAIGAALGLSPRERDALLEPVRHRAAVHARLAAWAAADRRTAELVAVIIGDLALDAEARRALVRALLAIRREHLARARPALPAPQAAGRPAPDRGGARAS